MASGKRKKDEKYSDATEAKLPPSKKHRLSPNHFARGFQQSDALKTVKEFLQCCESDGYTKAVAEFFEAGKTVQELVSLIQRNKATHFIPVLSALHFIVLTVVRDAPAHKADTEEACKYLLDHFLPEMQEMLSPKSTAKNKKIVLKLFATMVTLSAKLARSILAHVKFTPHMLALLTKHTRPSESSVRTCFIHFLMSFFIDKNTLLITSLLQKKGVLTSIISGLMYDDVCTVNLVLTTLYESVIMNTNVSKTLKLHTFSTPVVQSLLKLYNWLGPGTLKIKNDEGEHAYEEDTKDDEKKVVVEAVHNFLTVLCASHKHGIAFHDKNVGTANKKCNELLQGVVESIEKPWENEYLSQLTLKILASCPDLVKRVIVTLEPYLEPRISLHWLKAVKFTKNIIQSSDPDVSLKPYAHSLKVQQLTSVIHTLAVPVTILHTISNKMLQHKHLLVRHEGTQLLFLMLDKLLCYITALKSWKLIDESVLQAICNEVVKQMPNPETVVSLWKAALKCEDVPDESVSFEIPTVSSHLSSVVDMWLLYNKCFSSTLNTINSLELLNDIQNLDESDVMHLQLKVLKFIMTLDSSALTPEKDLFRMALIQLSQFTNHTSQEVMLDSRNIFTELLINSGIFEGIESEVNIWAYCCFQLPHKHANLVMQLLIKAMLDINKNPNFYANVIVHSEESVENDFSKDTNKLEQMLEDLLETHQSENSLQAHDDVVKPSCQITLSLLLPAVLENANCCKEYRENSSVINFLSSVIIHLIHFHTSPSVLWHLVQNNCDFLPINVSAYIDGWLNKDIIVPVKDLLGKNSTEAKLGNALMNGEDSLFTLLNLECTDNGTEDENTIPIVLKKHTVFVNKATIRTVDPVHLVLLYKLVVFHLTQMARQETLKESTKDLCEDALVIMLTILQKFSREQQNQYTSDCLKFTFSHPILLALFKPLHKKKMNIMIVQIIERLASSVPLSPDEVSQILLLFKQKVVHQIIRYVKKCQRTKISEERNLPTLSVYGLTSADIVLLMDLLILVPEETLYYCKEEIRLLSTLAKILSELLNLCVLVHEPLPSHCFASIAAHLVKMKKLQIVDMGLIVNNLCRYLHKFRHNLEDIPGYLYHSLLLHEEVDLSLVQLAALLLRHKTNLSEFFVSFVRKNRKFRSKSELLFPILSALNELSDSPLEETVLEKVYAHYCSDIKHGILVSLDAAGWIREYEHIAVLLIEKCMDLNTCVLLCKQMESGIKLEKSESFCFEIMKAVLCKVNRLVPEQFNPNVVLLIVMQLVNDLWKRKLSDKKQLENIHTLVKACARSSNDTGCQKWEELKNSSLWMKFVITTLKYGIQVHKEVLDSEGHLLHALTELCTLVYKVANKDDEVLRIFQMALSHSEFLAVILGDATKKKYHLVELLLLLMEKNSSVMLASHIPIILGSYQGTLCETDQNLLKILKMYEAGGVHFHNYKPYLWGEAAVSHYSVKSQARFALWRQPKPSQVLDLLEMECVQQTVKRFPINRDLDGSHSAKDIDDSIYDIAFLLPLFSHLLAPEQFVPTQKFMSCGGLALTLSALASECEMTRKAAYHVLSRFYFHEEANRNAKKRMLSMQFLDALRLGIAGLNSDNSAPQLSSVVAAFLARASLIISQANHPLYSHIQNFIIAKPSLNLQMVPEFLTYFHSADVEYKLHRYWILEVIRDGFKSELDLKVCLRSAVFKLLYNFYFSVLADESVKTLILEVIHSAVKVPKTAWLLVSEFGLVSQLFHVIRQFPEDSNGKTVIVNLLHDLWTSLSSKALDDCKKRKGHNVVLCQQVIMLLFSVLLVKPNLSESQLKAYLSTFHAVLSFSDSQATFYLLRLEDMNHLLQFVTKVLGPIPECEDMLKYGCKYIVIDEKHLFSELSDSKKSVYYLKKIIVEWFHKVHNYKAPKMKHSNIRDAQKVSG